MPDPPAKPTAQAMKAAAAIVAQNYGWCEYGGDVHLRYAKSLDASLGLPAMLKNVAEAEAYASDLETATALISGQLIDHGFDEWTEPDGKHIGLAVDTVIIEVPDDVMGLFPFVTATTKQFPWKARLVGSHWLEGSGEYELEYEMGEQEKRP